MASVASYTGTSQVPAIEPNPSSAVHVHTAGDRKPTATADPTTSDATTNGNAKGKGTDKANGNSNGSEKGRGKGKGSGKKGD